MNKPFFSIILATYNRAHLLHRPLASVMAQSYQDWELIILDDGSVDGTSSVVRQWQEKEPRIRAIFLPHQGLALTRNAGIEAAIGEYVTFIDSDDEYLEHHLAYHAELLAKESEIDMVHGKVAVEGDPYVPDAFHPGKLIAISECTQPGTFFIRRDLLRSLGGFPIKDFGEDSALLNLMKEKQCRLKLSPFVTYKYYNNEPDSMCNQMKTKMKSELVP